MNAKQFIGNIYQLIEDIFEIGLVAKLVLVAVNAVFFLNLLYKQRL